MSHNISQSNAQPTKFIGWRMVVICGLIYAFVGALGLTVGQLTLSYMVLDPAVTMNRTYLGLGFTVFILVQGLSGPLIAQIVTKKGARTAYITGAIIAGVVSVALALFLGSSTLFYILFFGVFLSFGCSTAGQIPGQSTLNQWFVAKRGKAISFMMMMAAIIAVFYPLLTNALINQFGWRVGFVLIACFALIGLCLAIFFVKNKPADVGQLPDGGEVTQNVSAESAQAEKKIVAKTYQAKEHKTVGQAVRTPAFWLIVFTAFTCFAHMHRWPLPTAPKQPPCQPSWPTCSATRTTRKSLESCCPLSPCWRLWFPLSQALCTTRPEAIRRRL